MSKRSSRKKQVAADAPRTPALCLVADGRSTPARMAARSARAGAVAKFRDLADRLERGEIDGARAQWREGLHFVEVVEMRHVAPDDPMPGAVNLTRVEIDSPERPASPPEPHHDETGR
jgi:hypothetical protein